MTVKELNIGDVFRVVGETKLWRKSSQNEARRCRPKTANPRAQEPWYKTPGVAPLSAFSGKKIVVVESAGEICRSANALILRGGEVTLDYIGAWLIHSYTPGDPLTEFVLPNAWFSCEDVPTEETALAFKVGIGSKHLGRASGTEIFAYKGRVYARATNKDVLGRAAHGGYRRLRKVDGAKRLVIAGLLTIPSEFALYDIIMELFGPDTVPR